MTLAKDGSAMQIDLPDYRNKAGIGKKAHRKLLVSPMFVCLFLRMIQPITQIVFGKTAASRIAAQDSLKKSQKNYSNTVTIIRSSER